MESAKKAAKRAEKNKERQERRDTINSLSDQKSQAGEDWFMLCKLALTEKLTPDQLQATEEIRKSQLDKIDRINCDILSVVAEGEI